MKIDVLDTAGMPVRHISDKLMSKGYSNLYWDKRDDSGKYVPRGLYYYRVNSICAPEFKRKLWAAYYPFERVVRIEVDTADKDAAATVVVDTPAVRLSLDVYRDDGYHADSLCVDTVLSQGRHRFVWRPAINTGIGDYWLRMKIESFMTEEKIRLR